MKKQFRRDKIKGQEIEWFEKVLGLQFDKSRNSFIIKEPVEVVRTPYTGTSKQKFDKPVNRD